MATRPRQRPQTEAQAIASTVDRPSAARDAPVAVQRRIIDDDLWWVLDNIPGWESHEVAVQAAIVNGEPRVTNLRLTVHKDKRAANSGITASRLRGLPMVEIARLAVSTDDSDVWREMGRIAKRPAARHDARAVASVEAYAEAYNLARERGLPRPREVASKVVGGLNPRTADRYRKRAEDLGLIEPKTKR